MAVDVRSFEVFTIISHTPCVQSYIRSTTVNDSRKCHLERIAARRADLHGKTAPDLAPVYKTLATESTGNRGPRALRAFTHTCLAGVIGPTIRLRAIPQEHLEVVCLPEAFHPEAIHPEEDHRREGHLPA